ncbi:MAG: hypothetical protein H6707_05150 [Deltaproteobacteria bacterium]|nr:hypothetical protein [Deltaproteobacteria bacterium]
MQCIAVAANKGRLDRAHACYRALRLLESARWWLKTMQASHPALPPVYHEPNEQRRLEFFCRLERLAEARSPSEVQRRYLAMIRSLP